ncbi:hypothetical protein ACQEVG_17240 [Streptomyces sp. CA-135486]
MKALIPTGDPAEPVVLADVPEPTPRPNEALVKAACTPRSAASGTGPTP